VIRYLELVRILEEQVQTDLTHEATTNISLVPMFNSYKLIDRILAGDGQRYRLFRNCQEVRQALQAAGVNLASTSTDFSDLDNGWIIEISMTDVQKDLFYAAQDPYGSWVM